MSRLLLDEQPLVILPKLAVAIGLNEAIVLQQLHYWVEKSKNEHDGKYWVYNSHEEWKKQFPFWSKNTIIRTFEKLEKSQLIETGTFNKNKSDRTKWYTVNYRMLEAYSRAFTQNEYMDVTKMSMPITQNENMAYPYWENGSSTQNGHMVNQRIPKTTSKITTEKDNVASAPTLPFSDIVDYLNEKAGTKYRASSKKTQNLIKARFNEGFTLDDFKTVIDKKTAEWLTDQKMNQYLRPETLFGTKFEAYLNQKGGQAHAKTKKHTDLSQYNFDKEPDFDF
ncbi:conserved phage C-terminal domain-containing protein [Bacillus badius]|uniref:Phage replication initiation protein n=1 Tax=Bacillus badius TaxID=1455 RepID=A0ABR5ANN5_BACBA|nr:conserved phage C-terminal domain-containing protein [Bacillus badius]KIL72368.1 Phage replication initiation protein [Bacillus badius]MED4718271.1 conserved phage C-terminal domain-containing protein [Bacillus badius]